MRKLTFKDYLGDLTIADISIEHQHNIDALLDKVGKLQDAYGKPFRVTSGYRSEQYHLKIYSKLGIHPPNVPMGSLHLSGQAVDIYDPKKEVMQFILDNKQLCEDLGLYFEDFRWTTNWVHIQTRPPRSGKRVFIPNSSNPPMPDAWNGVW